MQDTLDTLYDNNLFTRPFDLRKGYHQIKVEESNHEKTAFTTHVWLFQHIRLPFGLTNAPASIQRLLEHIRDYIGKFVIIQYIGDILMISSTFEDHLSHVAQVLQTLKLVDLKIRNKKY